MRFIKKGKIYITTRITGTQDNILGISFDESNSNKIEVLEWPIETGCTIQTSKEEVLEQVLSSLESINRSLNTNYKLSKIYFLPSEKSSDLIYKLLISKLIRHYHEGKEFKKSSNFGDLLENMSWNN